MTTEPTPPIDQLDLTEDDLDKWWARCGTGMAGVGLREQRALLLDARTARRIIARLETPAASPSAPRVDPSRLAGGGDLSRAVVVLPDGAIEAAERALVNRFRPAPLTDDEWLMIKRQLGRTASWPIAEVAVTDAYPLIAAAVRAEAVAGERRRIAAALDAEAHRVAEVPADAIRNEAYWAGRVEGVVSARNLAAGSVPVATPEPWGPFRNRVDWLRDQHARYHDQPGNMLGRDECGWEPCRFWDGAEWVLDARPADPVAARLQPERVGFGTDAFEVGGSLPGQPVATPTEPKPGSDQAYRLQARLQAENRLVATLHGRSDPCRCPDCAASPVPAVQPHPWFRETPESLVLLEAEQAEVAAVEAAAEQTRCIAPVDGFRCVHPAGHAGDHERCGDPGGGIGCPVPGCRHDVPADQPEKR